MVAFQCKLGYSDARSKHLQALQSEKQHGVNMAIGCVLINNLTKYMTDRGPSNGYVKR